MLRKTAVITGVVATVAVLLLGAWRLGPFLLQMFGAVLFAIFLDGASQWLARRTGVPRLFALVGVGVGLLAATAGAAWLVGPRLATELEKLGQLIPKAVDEIRTTVVGLPGADRLLTNGSLASSGAAVAKELGRTATSTAGVLSNLVLVPVVGAYLALHPDVYVRGLVALIPGRRAKTREVLETSAHVTRRWLLGRLASMAAIGLLTGLGLFILDVPLAFTLGFVAGLLSFVPFLGPLLSVVPAILVALPSGGWQLALWVAVLYASVQAVEGTIITPQIEKKAVFLPPALLIAFQIAMGMLGGVMGVVLATPLLVVSVVLLQILFVRDVLGRRVRVIGTPPLPDGAS